MTVRRTNNKLPPFVALTWEVLNSHAYKALPFASAKALPYFFGKTKKHYKDPQRYLNEFSLPYGEANRYGFAPATFSKVIQELVKKGFIDPVDKGGLRSDGKSYNRYRLSRRWEKYGTSDFIESDWKCFIPKPRSRATSKSEINSVKKGNMRGSANTVIPQIEVAEVVSG